MSRKQIVGKPALITWRGAWKRFFSQAQGLRRHSWRRLNPNQPWNTPSHFSRSWHWRPRLALAPAPLTMCRTRGCRGSSAGRTEWIPGRQPGRTAGRNEARGRMRERHAGLNLG